MEYIIGSRIRELRREKGCPSLSLPQPAAIGVSNGVISLWENGVNEPKASCVIALCKFFSVSADYLLGIEQ